MNIDATIAKARRKLERLVHEAEARNVAAWRERGYSDDEIAALCAACAEHNELALDEAIDDLRATLELRRAMTERRLQGEVVH